jgi:hypothetical protein
MSVPLSVDQRQTLLSPKPPPDASFFPVSSKHTDSTRPVCPVNVQWHSPVVVFQSWILLSQLPLAIVEPLELHATEVTLRLR